MLVRTGANEISLEMGGDSVGQISCPSAGLSPAVAVLVLPLNSSLSLFQWCLLHLRGEDAGRVELMRSVHVHSPPSRLHGYMHCDVGLLV